MLAVFLWTKESIIWNACLRCCEFKLHVDPHFNPIDQERSALQVKWNCRWYFGALSFANFASSVFYAFDNISSEIMQISSYKLFWILDLGSCYSINSSVWNNSIEYCPSHQITALNIGQVIKRCTQQWNDHSWQLLLHYVLCIYLIEIAW